MQAPINTHHSPTNIHHRYLQPKTAVGIIGHTIIVDHKHASYSRIETIEKCVSVLAELSSCRESHFSLTTSYSPTCADSILKRDDAAITMVQSRFQQLCEEAITSSQQEAASRLGVPQASFHHDTFQFPERRASLSDPIPFAPIPNQRVIQNRHQQVQGQGYPAPVPMQRPVVGYPFQNPGSVAYHPVHQQGTSPPQARIRHFFTGRNNIKMRMTKEGLEINHCHGKFDPIPSAKRVSAEEIEARVCHCAKTALDYELPKGCPFSESAVTESITHAHNEIFQRLKQINKKRKQLKQSKDAIAPLTLLAQPSQKKARKEEVAAEPVPKKV